MAFLLDNVWLAVGVPFAVALTVGLLGRYFQRAVPWVTMLAPLTVLATGVAWFAEGHHHEHGAQITKSTAWLFGTLEQSIGVGWRIDGLIAIMLLVVGVVASAVVMFSVGYMDGEEGLPRYFALLALFSGAMTTLVIADGLVGLFVGWELVGACSYLLIGFWFTKPSAAAAAVKAFLTTRVGDVGLLLGIALLWRETGRLDYPGVFAAAENATPEFLAVVGLLLFVGAAGKSAQFPLHIWLPDAMEGPTPVSALIHAATMVAAGVFLIARTWPIYEGNDTALGVILVIGTFTALAAATIAVAQTDIKKVLAYSTISQLGFMFAALGAGAWPVAMFHLVTHAAFKSLLFLGSGSVIHGSGTQDLREMGGLAKRMPVTAVTWIIGSAALAGVPFLAGFFSKDEVLHSVMGASPVAGIALFAASLLTAFYITRATRLAFFDSYRGDGHPHEGNWTMKVPLIVLALGAVGLGYLGHQIAEAMGGHAESLDLTTALISGGIALAGIALGWFAYRQGAASETDMEARFSKVWPVLRNAYGFDEFVMRAVVRPTVRLCGWTYSLLDRAVIDRIAEGLGSGAEWLGAKLADLQGGDAQWYAALLGAGAVLLMALAMMGWQ